MTSDYRLNNIGKNIHSYSFHNLSIFSYLTADPHIYFLPQIWDNSDVPITTVFLSTLNCLLWLIQVECFYVIYLYKSKTRIYIYPQ